MVTCRGPEVNAVANDDTPVGYEIAKTTGIISSASASANVLNACACPVLDGLRQQLVDMQADGTDLQITNKSTSSADCPAPAAHNAIQQMCCRDILQFVELWPPARFTARTEFIRLEMLTLPPPARFPARAEFVSRDLSPARVHARTMFISWTCGPLARFNARTYKS